MVFRAFLFLFFVSVSARAQTTYGNDWINFSQTYYKIKIVKEGVYRITQSQLTQAGLPVTQINPKNIQLYNKGREVTLFVSGDNDGSFDAGDYLEFYGSKNDGQLDKPLYTNPTDQPHDFYSLYTDTAAYFLTWTVSSPGKRFASSNHSAIGLTAEPYFMHTAVSYFTDGGYYPGAYILAQTSVSEYTQGEGILGALFYHGAPQVRTIETPFLHPSGGAILAETYVAGRSNSITGKSDNHHLRIEVSKDGTSYAAKKDALYREYNALRSTFTIDNSELGNTTFFRFSAVKDLAASTAYENYTDYQAPGYIKITYPRQYNLEGVQALKFTLKGLQPSPVSLLKFNNSNLVSPVLLDLTNNLRINANHNAGVLEAAVPGAGTDKEIYLYSAEHVISPELELMNFTDFAPSSFNKNFLIITHTSLLSEAQKYPNYREQTGYRPIVVITDQLYNQFYYGLQHPLAIRNFCKFLLEKAPNKPEYLLLLGKGQSHFSLKNLPLLNLVPGIGNPPSDHMLTSGLAGTSWEPAIPTGRIPAQTPAEVEIYLNKLKT